ncbi:MAG: transcriptional repressor [Paludibacteraceae bacterium]|nr:transcriptional repressor [Paludibacteraceae bacterium]
MNATQEIVSQLQEAGFKPSLQRIAILEYLRTHFTHPTVDEIYEALSPSMPTLSKTTIYNTLRSFSQSGLALSLRLDEKNVHYDGDTAPHAHFICKDCGKIMDVVINNTDMLHIPTLCGAEVQAVEISYYGQCDTCKKQKEK